MTYYVSCNTLLRQELASLRKQIDEREKQSWRELGDLQRQLEDASATSVDADSMKRRVAELVKQHGADQVVHLTRAHTKI